MENKTENISKEKALEIIAKCGDKIHSLNISFSYFGCDITKERAKKIVEWSKSIRLLSDEDAVIGHKLEIVFEDKEMRKGALTKYFLEVEV